MLNQYVQLHNGVIESAQFHAVHIAFVPLADFIQYWPWQFRQLRSVEMCFLWAMQ